MTLGELIKARRAALGIDSQYRLAKELGVVPAFISQLESGARRTKKHEFILRLASRLGVPSDEIYLAQDTVPPDLIDALKDAGNVRTVRSALGIPTPEEP